MRRIRVCGDLAVGRMGFCCVVGRMGFCCVVGRMGFCCVVGWMGFCCMLRLRMIHCGDV
jgi:hypothetical protein